MNFNIFAVSVLVSALFCSGSIILYIYLKNPNTCSMTYMFEYPQYVKVFSGAPGGRNPQYGLYAYSEGKDTEKVRKLQFSGIPVLFIPGSSGSFKQVRSLASVSLRKALDSRSHFHFDFFAVDLNEEQSALFGGVLKHQTEFVNACLRRILAFYRSGPNSPRSVILIGHSMGGIVARGVFLEPDFKKGLVSVVITIAAPHLRPVVYSDWYIEDYYNRVNSFWLENRHRNLSEVTFVSIGGGDRDILIPSEYTYSEDADISVLSTAIPTVWKSVDHFCSVWCKELVLVVVRSLFDIVDTDTKQVSLDVEHRRNAFSYHLIHRTAGKHLSTSYHPPVVAFQPEGHWRESLQRQYKVKEPRWSRTTTYIMVRLLEEPDREFLTVEAINLKEKDWIFACIADKIYNNSRICDFGINLSNLTQILPSSNFKRKTATINLFTLFQDSFSHVIIRILPSSEPVRLNIDIHSRGRRVPADLSGYMSVQTVVPETEKNAVYYGLELYGFEKMIHVFDLIVEPLECKTEKHHAVAILKVPWRKEDIYYVIDESTRVSKESLPLVLHTSRPHMYPSDQNPFVSLILDPQCKYSISVRRSELTLARFIPFCTPMIWSYVIGTLILALSAQLRRLARDGCCVPFHIALLYGTCNFFVVIVLMFLSLLLSSSFEDWFHPFVPVSDFRILEKRNVYFAVLPFILLSIAMLVSCCLGFGCWLSIIFSGHLVHKTALRVIVQKISFLFSWTAIFDQILEKFPVVAGAFLAGLGHMSFGAIGLFGATTFYFILLTKMFDDFLNYLLTWSVKIIIKKTLGFIRGKQSGGSDSSEVRNDGNKTVEKSNRRKRKDSSKKSGAKKNKAKRVLAEKDEAASSSSKEPELPKETEKLSSESASDMEVVSSTDTSTDHSEEKPSEDPVTVTTDDRNEESYLTGFHFHFTIMLLWFSVSAVYIPCALVWAHNYRYTTKLNPDPSFTVSMVLLFCLTLLWQDGPLPRRNLRHYKLVSYILLAIAFGIFVYTPVTVYRLGYFVCAAFVVVVFQQLFDSAY